MAPKSAKVTPVFQRPTTGFLLFCKTTKVKAAMKVAASLDSGPRSVRPSVVAADAWNRLSDEEKAPFEDKAAAQNLLAIAQAPEADFSALKGSGIPKQASQGNNGKSATMRRNNTTLCDASNHPAWAEPLYKGDSGHFYVDYADLDVDEDDL